MSIPKRQRHSYAFPHAGRQHPELIPILRNGSTGNLYAISLEYFHDRLICEGIFGVLVAHQLVDGRLDAASRHVVDNPDEKKYFSGNTPRGVCAYFSLVTRLTVDSCIPIASATSRNVSGFRKFTPFSKKSRCRSTIKCITLSIVCRRCSIA